jgi:hypothetical protein
MLVSNSPHNLSDVSREGRQAQVASQKQLEEMAARCGVGRAQDLLVAAEMLADEFGETVALEAVMAALEQCLARPSWVDTDTAAGPERQRENQPVYAHLDETGLADEEARRSASASYAGRHDQAAPGRVSLRSLLAGRRSSDELIDEDQALANCKPLSTAVLSINRERSRTSRLTPRSTPASPPPSARQDALRAPGADATRTSRSSRLSSPLAGSSATSSSGSSDDAA